MSKVHEFNHLSVTRFWIFFKQANTGNVFVPAPRACLSPFPGTSLPPPPPLACEVTGCGRGGAHRGCIESPPSCRRTRRRGSRRLAGPPVSFLCQICLLILGDAVPSRWWPWSRSSPRWSATAARTRRSRCPPTTTCARDPSAWRIRCTASNGASPNRAGTVDYHRCPRAVCTENRPILPKS